ncbi:MAG: FkbM family methyltransferase [Betaproteobacteria bacterium]|nr:FkbM family methyltransferase [Betaproteobacteria bacterium]
MIGRSAFKLIYRRIPFKKSIFQIIRNIWKPSERIYQHLHFIGKIRVFLDDPLHSVVIEHRASISENQLFWAGIDGWYERTSLRCWLNLARQASIIVDVGANSGFYALSASSVNPSATIYAFEPVPNTFNWLCSNILSNRYNNIFAEQIALSNYDGKAGLWFDSIENHYAPSLYEAGHKSINQGFRIEVSTCSLDSYFIRHGISGLHLVKIDVERHEPQVLRGMRYLLQQFRPTLLLEVLDDEVAKRVQDEVDGFGYYYFSINEQLGSLRKVDRIAKSDTLNFLVIQPQFVSLLNNYLESAVQTGAS